MSGSILSKKGWIVIPKEIREKYRLVKGERVNLIDYGGVISIIPLAKDSISESEGFLRNSISLTGSLLTERKKDKKSGK
jgi:AbrB family looped-hinge helix DNA binding protein